MDVVPNNVRGRGESPEKDGNQGERQTSQHERRQLYLLGMPARSPSSTTAYEDGSGGNFGGRRSTKLATPSRKSGRLNDALMSSFDSRSAVAKSVS